MNKISTALILAAGLGSRLGPLTLNSPKAMLNYNEKEIILYQLDTLKELGINNIIVVVGYHSHVLIEFINKKYKNIKFVLNNMYASTNSAYSLNCGISEIKSESYIHINCDILFSKKLLSSLINSSFKNIICARNDLVLGDGMENIVVDEKNRIIDMSIKKKNNSEFKGYGLAKISQRALNENIVLYNKMEKKLRNKENYYGLIRNNLEKNDYFIIKSDKKNLAEINTEHDLKICSFQG
jgi:choline kinase